MRPWSEILTDALESFEGGKRWCRHQLFTHTSNSHNPGYGERFVNNAKSANRYCAYGAITRSMVLHGELKDNPFGKNLTTSPVHTVVERLMGNGVAPVVSINDDAPTFSTVQQMFCRGIKKALEEEETNNENTQAASQSAGCNS